MEITLTYRDIEKAIKGYVKSIGINAEVEEIRITTKRSSNEPYRAEIVVGDVVTPAQTVTRETTGNSDNSVARSGSVESIAEEGRAEEPSDSITSTQTETSTSSTEKPLNIFGG